MALAGPAHLHVHHGGRYRLHDADHRARIGVEQFLVLAGPVRDGPGAAITAPQLHAGYSPNLAAPQRTGSPRPEGHYMGTPTPSREGHLAAMQAWRPGRTEVCRAPVGDQPVAAARELRTG